MGIRFIQDLAVVMLIAGFVSVVCRRLHLSVVVGFLVAGVVIGPYTPPFELVSDIERVRMLADLGLIFLIFAIGLDLNLKRLQRLGASITIATFVSSMLVLSLSRILGLVLGWNSVDSLFLAGILMVSSSAIISKVLEELGLTHERSAQLALGVTVLEDVAAVTMLTVLTSIVQFGEAGAGQIVPTLGSIAAFVAVLFLGGLLVVPRLLNLLDRIATAEMRNIVVVGLLLGLGWLAVEVGYSAALSAFVLGAVVGGTRHKASIERALQGMRHVFGAVFFVAMGMLLDLQLLWTSLDLVIIVSACAIVGRLLATSVGLLSVGQSFRDSVRAGLNLTPIGEFSFIIAQLGVSSGVAPKALYPVAVGVSLVTAMIGPVLTRHSEPLASWAERITPQFLRSWIDFYHQRVSLRRFRVKGTEEGRAALKPLILAGLHIALISALLLTIDVVYEILEGVVGEDWLFPGALKLIVGIILGVFLLAPILAAWRHLCNFALALMPGVSPFVEVVIKAVIGLVLGAWLIVLLPFDFAFVGSLVALIGSLVVISLLAWRRLGRWHAIVEDELTKQIQAAQSPIGADRLAQALRERPAEWDLRLEEVALPEGTPHAGRSIAALEFRKRFGCSIVGIERRGFAILNPSRDDVLYPGDRLLLLGTMDQLDHAETFLRSAPTDPEAGSSFEELTIESHTVPEASPVLGSSLLDLDVIHRFGVQIGGIQREGTRMGTPTGATELEPDDEILLIGTPSAILELVQWMNTPRPA